MEVERNVYSHRDADDRVANGIDDQSQLDDIQREFNLAPYSESEADSAPCGCRSRSLPVDPQGPQTTPAVKVRSNCGASVRPDVPCDYNSHVWMVRTEGAAVCLPGHSGETA
ncbi:hypothetical protein M4951_01685 [Blastopirellula sp. J2-11]|uniref:hypothetical protein n=1 Tax=Blastopirellula sp. J2-11 TaxID=2943192 RepID=UPI0021C5E5B6|nr:hypothetical protein [Blastopirellula sp. J2-11]UUO07035.1 hypothetical protein M4951_01685 [Blastopirellula sp. J2-11]